jgi:hypothetical protein
VPLGHSKSKSSSSLRIQAADTEDALDRSVSSLSDLELSGGTPSAVVPPTFFAKEISSDTFSSSQTLPGQDVFVWNSPYPPSPRHGSLSSSSASGGPSVRASNGPQSALAGETCAYGVIIAASTTPSKLFPWLTGESGPDQEVDDRGRPSVVKPAQSIDHLRPSLASVLSGAAAAGRGGKAEGRRAAGRSQLSVMADADDEDGADADNSEDVSEIELDRSSSGGALSELGRDASNSSEAAGGAARVVPASRKGMTPGGEMEASGSHSDGSTGSQGSSGYTLSDEDGYHSASGFGIRRRRSIDDGPSDTSGIVGANQVSIPTRGRLYALRYERVSVCLSRLFEGS